MNSMLTQRGATLVVGLVFLLILTILGISGMRMARSQLVMAGNEQFYAQAINIAEAAINAQIASNSFLLSYTTPSHPVSVTPTFSGAGSSTIEYLNQGPAPDGGYSDDVLTYRFRIDATAQAPAGNNARARVALKQGIYVLAPGN